MKKSSSEDSVYYCWDEFRDLCEDFNINLEDTEETAKWRRFWEFWKEGIDKKMEYMEL